MTTSDFYRRRLQLVAGVTYSVSLPKQWVEKNHLRNKQEVVMAEKSDGSLVLSPVAVSSQRRIDSFSIDLDKFEEDISQALFVLYYIGTETISISSKKDIPPHMKSLIKDSLRYMIGTEILSEDRNKIVIKVLLDKSKVDINQLYYRVALLIGSSIEMLFGNSHDREIDRTEDEIDRLYHLISKILLLSHTNAEILQSSRIENVHYLTSYQLIAKKLENIADDVYRIALVLRRQKHTLERKHLMFIKERLNQGMVFFMNKSSRSFSRTERHTIQAMEKDIAKIKSQDIARYLDDMLRFLVDIEEELTQISFATKLVKENIL
jgi:phosphate uptake regulator